MKCVRERMVAFKIFHRVLKIRFDSARMTHMDGTFVKSLIFENFRKEKNMGIANWETEMSRFERDEFEAWIDEIRSDELDEQWERWLEKERGGDK